MPPKKKRQKEADPFVDVMSCLDEVDSCLTRAERSSKACLEGITKAGLALKESRGDSDIQCVVLVKRTELLFIAAKNNYNLDSLPGPRNQYSLDVCIADCETVLNDVSANDLAGKQVRATAKAVCMKAQKLMKDREYEEKKRRGSRSNNRITETTYDPTFKRYDPSKTSFKNIDKINPYLLQDIVECYKQARSYCRTCFYRRHTQEPVVTGRHCRGCKKIPQPLVMIPASKMCENLGGAKMVPITPPPKMMMQAANKHRLFQICKNRDHQLCDDKASVGENWFAHSIEELVIWTVQRFYGCKFHKYIEDHHCAPQFQSEEDGLDTDDLFSDSYSEENNSDDERFDYYPEDLTFHEVDAIPRSLMLNVVEKYRHVKEYCKLCFYKTNKQGVPCTDRNTKHKVCSICGASWRSIRVVPASEYCWNFGDFDFLPIAPWPVGKPGKDAFEYCKKKDHFRCFHVYPESEFWYPHSVEEMVVWTVEREKKCSFKKYIDDMSSIQPSASNGVQHRNQQPKQDPSHRAGPSPPPHEELNYGPYPPGHPAGGVRPRPPLLSTPTSVSASPQPLSGGVPDGNRPAFPPPNMNGPGPPGGPNGAAVGRNMPFPPPHFPPPAGDFHPFNNGGGGGGGPMMYLSQPGPMYHPQRAVLIPRLPIHGGLSQQPMPYPGPNQPPRVLVPPHTMYNPYLTMGPNFAPMYPAPQQAVPGQPPGLHPEEAAYVEPSTAGGRDDERGNGSSRSSPPGMGVASSATSDGGSSPFQTITSAGTVEGSPGRVSAGRKNYKVARSPATAGAGQGGGASVPFSGGIRGGRAGGMSSSSSSRSVEVKVVSASPIPATRVETPLVFKFSEVNFKSFLDIPSSLLRSIALCFRDKEVVCRKCFYGERSLSTKSSSQSGGEVTLCSEGEHKWLKPVVVIPGCSMCNNEPSFQPGEHVPIPPLPPVAVLKKCSSRNHHKCFTKCLDQDTWQAHSVEELVVWMVESEKDCSFEEYAAKALEGPAGVAVSPVSGNKLVTSARSPARPSSDSPSDSPSDKPAPLPSTQAKSKRKYHPKDFSFVDISDIPSDLLVSVAECYKSMQIVCRICFFESNCTTLVGRKKDRTCAKEHLPWKPIKVIPRSPLCQTQSVFVPLPPLPKHMRQSSVQFMVCKKTDHRTCFAMSRGTNPWFPHTVEELVVWTVEREFAQPFDEVYTQYLPSNKQSSLASNAPDKFSSSKVAAKAVVSPTSESYSNVVSDNSRDASKASTPDWDAGVVAKDERGSHNPSSSSVSKSPSVDEKHFSEALDLEGEGSSSEFPLGAYRSQPRPLLDPKDQESDESANWGEAEVLNYFKAQKWWSPGIEEAGKEGAASGFTSFTADDFEEYPVRPSDDFIHQSQVESDMFQPYAARSPLVLSKLGIDSERSPKQSVLESSMKGADDRLPGLGINTDDIPKSKEIGLEDRDWNDEDDLLIEKSGSPDDFGLEFSPGARMSSPGGRGVIDPSPGGRSSRGAGNRRADRNTNNNSSSLGPGSKASAAGNGLAPGGSSSGLPPISRSDLPWSIGDTKDSVAGLGGFDLDMGSGGKGLWDNTSWGNPSNSSSFMASAFAAANSIASEPESKPAALDPLGSMKETSFPSALQTLDDAMKSKDEALFGSSDENNGIGDGKFFCLLCYAAFRTAGDLFAHCSTASTHQELAALDTGAEMVWQHVPPPPKQGNIPIPKVCNSSVCGGSPVCKHPHSQEELGEWLVRWQHRDQRRKEGLRLARMTLQSDGRNGVPIVASKVLQATVSEAYKIDNCYRWDVTIQGKNWLNLFGVTISTSSSWIFKITHIEEPVTPSIFHPHSSSWTAPPFRHAHHLRQCLLLGLVEIKIKAIPPSNKKQPPSTTPVSAEVKLDLGFKQYFTIPLHTSSEAAVGSVKDASKQLKRHSPVEDTPLAPHLGIQPTFAPGQLPPFAPQHPWRLSQQSSSSDDDLGNLNMEGEDLTLQHVPIEDWGCSLTDEHGIAEH